jgi:hypothetical protein
MKFYLPLFLLLVCAALITLSCGSSGRGSLSKVSISPASADASSYPDGEVPFVATGYYSDPSSTVTPFSATWGSCTQAGSATTAVTVSAGGTAQCGSGASGTYTVWAFGLDAQGAVCNVLTACGGGCGHVTGTAQITCP